MFDFMILGYDLYHLFFYFIIYAFIGWCMETAYVSSLEKRFVNRGFLNGPFCPIYGFGVIIIISVLKPIENNSVLLFLGSFVLTSLLEYFTAFILEKAFKSTWWDYSDKPFNIHGRICLSNSILWAALSMLIVRYIQPYTAWLIDQIPSSYGAAIANTLLLYFAADFTFTIISVIGLNNKLKQLYLLSVEFQSKMGYLKDATMGYLKDATKDKITELERMLEDLKQKYNNLLAKNRFAQVRLLKAFPGLKSLKFNNVLQDLKENIRKYGRF